MQSSSSLDATNGGGQRNGIFVVVKISSEVARLWESFLRKDISSTFETTVWCSEYFSFDGNLIQWLQLSFRVTVKVWDGWNSVETHAAFVLPVVITPQFTFILLLSGMLTQILLSCHCLVTFFLVWSRYLQEAGLSASWKKTETLCFPPVTNFRIPGKMYIYSFANNFYKTA